MAAIPEGIRMRVAWCDNVAVGAHAFSVKGYRTVSVELPRVYRDYRVFGSVVHNSEHFEYTFTVQFCDFRPTGFSARITRIDRTWSGGALDVMGGFWETPRYIYIGYLLPQTYLLGTRPHFHPHRQQAVPPSSALFMPSLAPSIRIRLPPPMLPPSSPPHVRSSSLPLSHHRTSPFSFLPPPSPPPLLPTLLVSTLTAPPFSPAIAIQQLPLFSLTRPAPPHGALSGLTPPTALPSSRAAPV